VIRHVPDSLEFFNIIFFVVLLSAAIQGLTIQTLASMLGISARPLEQTDPARPR
jgi:NhaP-type Na+/H+ and K+/H+ antiporter